MGQKTAQMREGRRRRDRANKGCFWKDTEAQTSHGNPTTPTCAGACTWITVLWRQHVSAGENSKGRKTGVKLGQKWESLTQAKISQNLIVRGGKHPVKRSPTPRRQSWRLCLDNSQSCVMEGRSDVCAWARPACGAGNEFCAAVHAFRARGCCGTAALTNTNLSCSAQHHAVKHGGVQRHTTRCPHDSGQAASPVSL